MANITFGNYSAETLSTKRCNYIPPYIKKGNCSYYADRFKNFMIRHPDCLHSPPVYYYGPLRNIKDKGKLSDYEKTMIRLKVLSKMRLSIFGDVDGHVEVEAAEKQRLKEDSTLTVYVKSNKKVIPTTRGKTFAKTFLLFLFLN